MSNPKLSGNGTGRGRGRETRVLAALPFHTAGMDTHPGWRVGPGTDCSEARQGVNRFKDRASAQ